MNFRRGFINQSVLDFVYREPRRCLKTTAALTLIALFVFSNFPSVHAHRHHSHQTSSDRQINVQNNGLATPSDLDSDLRSDRLTLHANGNERTISIRFGDARSSQISFGAGTDDPGNLITKDIDHDGDVDLVWVGRANPQRAVILLNDGDGNFVEATDNSPYASELDGLFGTIDPYGNLKLKRGRKSSTLTSTGFHEVGLPLFIRFQCNAIGRATVSIERQLPQSPFACFVRKRGPPVVLS